MLQWIKRVFDSDKYKQSSITMMDQLGYKGSSPLPFNYRNAVRFFRSWVYAAAHINATAVAATPLRLYIRSDNRTKSLWRTRPITKSRRSYLLGDMAGDVRPSRTVMGKMMAMGPDFEEVTEQHPVLEMLSKANGVYNGFDLTVLRTLYQELTGNAYLHVITDPSLDIPVELWPMPSQHVQVVPSKENFIDGYVYGANETQALRFERDEVIHFKRPNPDNLFYGLGKVEAAYGTIQANQAVHDMDLATFANHARPDYAVVVNGNARRADLDIFEQHVSERLRGTRKSGQFLAVSGDVKFEPLNFPPKDLGGRDEIVEEIAAVFGVPVSMLKANDPNLASARAGFGQWREGTILPLLRMDEDVLNQVLLPMFGIEGDACLAYDNPVPADSAFQLQQRTAAVSGGWQTLNEARIEQGLEPSQNPLADELMVGGQPLGGGLDVGFDLPLLPEPEQAEPVDEPDEAPVQDEPQPEIQEPEISEALALNGAQIASIVEVLQNVTNMQIAPAAGVELIVAAGIGREQAVEMMSAQTAQTTPTADPEAQKAHTATIESVLKSVADCTISASSGIAFCKSMGIDEGAAREMVLGQVVLAQDHYRKQAGQTLVDYFETIEEAEARARELGCQGHHVHEMDDGRTLYMPCAAMDDYTDITGLEHAEKAIADVDTDQGQDHYRKQAEEPLFDYFDTPEEAEARALEIGCEGHHVHEMDDGRTLYMPCSEMSDYTARTGIVHEKAVEDVDTQPTQEMADLAERGLMLREEHGRGGTEIGVARARDIKNRVDLSPETVGRMANFFSRHRVDLDAPAAKPGNDGYPSAGVIAWMLWGGDPANPDGAGNAWAQRKLEEIDGQREKAMDCNCKAEGDRISATPAKPSERIEGSDENKPGTAAGSRGGIEISEAQEKALEKKRDEHNEKHGDVKSKRVDLGMLKAVYRRGAGAFSTSHRPGMSRQQWSMARVNAFLYLVRNGRPKDAKYTTDNDLLPKGHPKRSD